MFTSMVALAGAPVLAMTGLAVCATSILGLARRRALVLRSRWLVWLLAAAAFPQVAASVAQVQAGAASLGTAAPALLAGMVLVCAFFRLRGFWVVGAALQGLGQELASGLRTLGQDAAEEPSGLRIQSLDAVLELRVQPWLGTATIRVIPETRERDLAGPLQHLVLPLSAPAFHGLALACGAALLALSATVLATPTPAAGSAMGFLDSATNAPPGLAGITTMVLAGLFVSVSLCQEHLICFLALASLIVWAISF